MKKTGFAMLCVLTAAALTGCGSNASVPGSADADTVNMRVVCTIFPEYDWVRQVLGDQAANVDVTYLLDSGTDLHSYQPTADDMVQIAGCDLFIYVGGESDEWAEDAIAGAVNPDIRTVCLMDVLGDAAKTEELKEGMLGEEEEAEGEDGEDEPEYDEHVWLSLKNAKVFCTEIEKNLAAIDTVHAAMYQANLDSYLGELDALDSDFKALTDASPVKTLVFGDRFPFRYFTDDYGLDYYAAFIGCSAESEASFETIAFLADKVKELDCSTVFTLENSDKSIAETVIRTSGKDVQIAELNSLQSVSADDTNAGATYLSLMKKNYDVLKKVME